MYTRAVSTAFCTLIAATIEIRAQLELNGDDRSYSFLCRRAHLIEVVETVELIFDRLDDQPLHLLRRGAGIAELNHDHRERPSPAGSSLRPILKNAIVPKIANAMKTIAVITGRLIAKRVNHTIDVPFSFCFTPQPRPLFQKCGLVGSAPPRLAAPAEPRLLS